MRLCIMLYAQDARHVCVCVFWSILCQPKMLRLRATIVCVRTLCKHRSHATLPFRHGTVCASFGNMPEKYVSALCSLANTN